MNVRHAPANTDFQCEANEQEKYLKRHQGRSMRKITLHSTLASSRSRSQHEYARIKHESKDFGEFFLRTLAHVSLT